MNQPVNQPMEPMNHGSSSMMWYIVGAVVVIALGALWYYSTQLPATNIQSSTVGTETSATEPTQSDALSSGNFIANILADLNQTSDDSAELNQAASISAQAVQGF